MVLVSSYPVESSPAIIHRNRVPMLRGQTVIHVKSNQIPIETVDDPFAKVMVDIQPTEDPSAAVEVYIGRSLLRLGLLVGLWCWLKDANSDLSSLHGTLLLCDAKDIRTGSTTVGDGVPGRILSILLYWHFVGMQTAGIVFVVVFDVDRVKARQELRGNAIVQRLMDLRDSKIVQGGVSLV